MNAGTGDPVPDARGLEQGRSNSRSDSTAISDGLLIPFLSSGSGEEARSLLGDLLERHLKPVVQGALRRRLRSGFRNSQGGEDMEDLVGDAIAKLVARLYELRDPGPSRDGEEAQPIADVRAFAATLASHVAEEHLRRKYPERRRLKNRIQYLLTHRPEFDLWELDDGGWYGGMACWRGRSADSGTPERITRLSGAPEDFERTELGGQSSSRVGHADLASAIFRWVGGPLELDDLVSLLRDLLNIREEVARTPDSEDELERRAARQTREPDVAEKLDRRRFLSRLWAEICDLPRRQRSAVLLNLRDEKGCSAVELFPILAVATIREIAAAVEIPAEEFAGLWNELPLEDALIASRLGITRQQVINLRKSARARLVRRLRDT